MNILVTNDDGIDATGLRTLVKELKKIGKVYVCAPAEQKSCSSISLSIRHALEFEKRDIEEGVEAYALYGTPADCARMGLIVLFRNIQFDLVVSGINHGFNGGNDIIYSGTVGAAREAFMDGVPAMAVSLDSFTSKDFSYAAEVGALMAQKFVKDPLRHKFVLNVNVPALPKEQIKGYTVCDLQGMREYNEHYYVLEKDGKKYIATGHNVITDKCDPEDLRYDTSAMAKGYVTLSAVGIDNLDHSFSKHLMEEY